MADLALGAVCRPKGTTASQSVTTSTRDCDFEHEVAEGGPDDPNDLNSCIRFNSGTWTQFYVNNNQDAYFGGASGNFAG
ncbi:hypothetical protein NW757_010128 [Fusarium falciforme]|nr:hypothetical protein NW757_010128 [Fusarium falciforme]